MAQDWNYAQLMKDLHRQLTEANDTMWELRHSPWGDEDFMIDTEDGMDGTEAVIQKALGQVTEIAVRRKILEEQNA